jgi:hypothetical protein
MRSNEERNHGSRLKVREAASCCPGSSYSDICSIFQPEFFIKNVNFSIIQVISRIYRRIFVELAWFDREER